jgi:predicted HTH domain antitoxin
MSLQTISIDLPADIFLTLNENEAALKERIKTNLAIELYREEKVTIGKAAQIANYTRLEFETLLSKMNIPISNLELLDIINDANKLK